MPKPQPHAVTIFPWLRANLGKHALAPLTSTDSRALKAAVQIVELWNFADAEPSRDLPNAFAACVRCMQESTREFAYHAIAHMANWSTREELWNLSGLPPITPRMRCENEPRLHEE